MTHSNHNTDEQPPIDLTASPEVVLVRDAHVAIAGLSAEIERLRTENILLRAENERLEQIAWLDSLTGVNSRRFFDEFCLNELEQFIAAKQAGDQRTFPKSILLCFADIDGLKKVNDEHPDKHTAGDQLIRAVADGIRHATRPSDTVCRYGGDEFVFMLRVDIDDKDVLRTLPSLVHQRAIAKATALYGEPVTFSLGFVNVGEYPSAQAAIQAADTEMYHLKVARNNFDN